jgi:hypothetical protein
MGLSTGKQTALQDALFHSCGRCKLVNFDIDLFSFKNFLMSEYEKVKTAEVITSSGIFHVF